MIKETIAVAVIAGTARVIAAADSSGFTLPGLTDLGNITATGAIIWYCYYTTTTTIPKIIADFRAEMAEVRKDRELERGRVSCKHPNSD